LGCGLAWHSWNHRFCRTRANERGFGPFDGWSTTAAWVQIQQQHRLSRIFTGGISESRSQTESDIKYDAKANLGGIGLLVDYYPMNNGLKLSGGLFKSNTDFTMKSTITAPTTVGNTSYTSGTIDGKVEFARDVSPMIAVGYVYNLGSNWTLGAELGAILNDGFKATATATGPITQADLDAEMKDLQDALSSTKMLPYISVMATYRF